MELEELRNRVRGASRQRPRWEYYLIDPWTTLLAGSITVAVHVTNNGVVDSSPLHGHDDLDASPRDQVRLRHLPHGIPAAMLMATTYRRC